MNTSGARKESCGTQLFHEDMPTHAWPIDQVIAFAEFQNRAMQTSEIAIVVTYWRLGTALNLLRHDFNHGQWQQLLEAIGIDKTRASKARAIARTFEDEWELEGMTVQQAYDCRHKRRRKRGRRDNDRDLWPLLELLDQFVEFAEKIQESKSTNDRPLLMVKLSSSIAALEALRNTMTGDRQLNDHSHVA